MMSDDNYKTENKIFTIKSVSIATFLGGPLVAGYLISSNYRVFGNDQARIKTLWWSVFAAILFFTVIYFIPENSVVESQLNYIMPTLTTGLAALIMQHFQGDSIQKHIDDGGEEHSGWRAAGVGFIGLLITLAIIAALVFGLIFLDEENFTVEGEMLSGFDNDNLAYYHNMDSSEARLLTDTLAEHSFFAENIETYVRLEKRDSVTLFQFPTLKEYWGDPEILSYFALHLRQLTQSFPDRHVAIEFIASDSTYSLSFDDPHLSLQWLDPKQPMINANKNAIQQLEFWKKYFSYAVENDLSSLNWEGVPVPYQFAGNGIALTNWYRMDKNWLDLYSSEEEARKVYDYMVEGFTDVRWVENDNIFKSHVSLITQMIHRIEKSL